MLLSVRKLCTHTPFIALTPGNSRRRQKCQPLQDAMGSTWSWDAEMTWLRLSVQPLCATPQPGHSRGWSPSRLYDPGARAGREMLPEYVDSFKTYFCFWFLNDQLLIFNLCECKNLTLWFTAIWHPLRGFVGVFFPFLPQFTACLSIAMRCTVKRYNLI